MERLPWPARAALGCVAAGLAVALTYSFVPLRAFPLLLAFPTVVLSAWFLGMPGGVVCAAVEAVLVDAFLTKAQERFSVGSAKEEMRLTVFLTVSILLGWTIRRLTLQRALLATRELEQRLSLATAERELAEERDRAILRASSSRFTPPRPTLEPAWACGWWRNCLNVITATYTFGARNGRATAGRPFQCFCLSNPPRRPATLPRRPWRRVQVPPRRESPH